MLCPYCGYENSKVLESRSTAEKSSIRRRRECESCQQRFTTYEKIEIIPVIVIKKNGSREYYTRDKLLKSIIKACTKCNVSVETINEKIDNIELELSLTGKKEVHSQYLGEKALETLLKINEVAYIRYMSVFKQITTVDELMHELRTISRQMSLV